MLKKFMLIFVVFCLFTVVHADQFITTEGIVVNLNEAPLNFKVRPDYIKAEYEDGTIEYPVFEITWENPESINLLSSSLPEKYTFFVAVDYRIKDGRWQSEFWEEKGDFSNTLTHPSKKKLIFDVTYIVQELDQKFLATDFEMRLCYGFIGDDGIITSPYNDSININSFEGSSPWAEEELSEAAGLGFITDRIKNKMSDPITREEFAEIAVYFYEKIMGTEALAEKPDTFADTTNPEILKAYRLKITNGAGKNDLGKDLFKPNDLLNREQMAAMITRSLFAVNPDIDLSAQGVSAFAHESAISQWALDSAKFMKKHKITEGIGNNEYGPKHTCTREQAVIFLTRAYLILIPN